MPLDLTPLSESTETLTSLPEDDFVEAFPALFPSAATYPSTSATFPSLGTARVGLWLEELEED